MTRWKGGFLQNKGSEGLSPGALKATAVTMVVLGVLCVVVSIINSGGGRAASSHPALSRMLLAALGVILVALGVTVPRSRNVPTVIGRFLFGVLMAFLVFEALATAGLFISERFFPKPTDPKEAMLRIHSDIYRPFVIWRAGAFSSPDMNISAAGLRVVPGACDSQDAFRVFMFGGSTMIGWDTTDGRTIAGNFQRMLSGFTNRPVSVTNFGQNAYVNTQELIELELQLRAGNVPDLVVFYDGSNEVWSAYEADTAGVHFFLSEIADLYENRQFRVEEGLIQPFIKILSGLSSVRLLGSVFGFSEPESGVVLYQALPSMCALHGSEFVDPVLFARDIMGVYEGNLRIIRALSTEFGFDCLVFWQPVVLTGNKDLTPEELAIAQAQNDFLHCVYQRCEAGARELELEYEGFVCITDVFDDRPERIFTDICHVNAMGDSLVAHRMFEEARSAGMLPAERQLSQ